MAPRNLQPQRPVAFLVFKKSIEPLPQKAHLAAHNRVFRSIVARLAAEHMDSDLLLGALIWSFAQRAIGNVFQQLLQLAGALKGLRCKDALDKRLLLRARLVHIHATGIGTGDLSAQQTRPYLKLEAILYPRHIGAGKQGRMLSLPCEIHLEADELTAQYWRSVWLALEHICFCTWPRRSPTEPPRGHKHDFRDAERPVRRLMADELILSFVPDGELRIWRNPTRSRTQLIRHRVHLHREMLALQLEHLELIDTQMEKLSRMIAHAMKPHREAVMRLAEVPGFGVEPAQQVISEVAGTCHQIPCPGEFDGMPYRLLKVGFRDVIQA
jgi:hypothetical protein